MCCFNEILRSFLVGDTSEESNDFILQATGLIFRTSLVIWLDGVMHRDDLVRIDAIFLHDDFSCKVADGNDDVGGFHATTFYRINESIDILSRTVELSGVHVNYERFSCRLFCRDASGICQPVVSVNNIELVFMFESKRRTDESVTRDFFHEVSTVFT